MRIRAASHPTAPVIPTAPPGRLEDILAQLESRTQPAPKVLRVERVRIRPRPRRLLLVAALPVLALGVAWTVCNALAPEPPAAPALKPNATVSVASAPAQAAPRQALHATALKAQPKSALEQARVLFPGDAKGFAFKFKPAIAVKFREPESYIVMFNVPARQYLLDVWKAHGVVLVENYGPLVSVFWMPSEDALKTMSEEPVQLCPLSDTGAK